MGPNTGEASDIPESKELRGYSSDITSNIV